MAIVSSGPVSFRDINVELGRSPTATISLGDTAVRSLLGIGSGVISLNNAYGKSSRTSPDIFTTAGTFAYVIPSYNTLTVEMWGGGGGGGATSGTAGGSGGATSGSGFGAIADGGGGGGCPQGAYRSIGSAGSGGTASGGNLTNTNGNPGVYYAIGGTAPFGGTGGTRATSYMGSGGNGNPPGGGGAGGYYDNGAGYWVWGGGGGSGAYVKSVFNSVNMGSPVIGSTIDITIGSGGAKGVTNNAGGSGGTGGAGKIIISWT